MRVSAFFKRLLVMFVTLITCYSCQKKSVHYEDTPVIDLINSELILSTNSKSLVPFGNITFQTTLKPERILQTVAPTGTVLFSDGINECTSDLNNDLTATCTLLLESAGMHPVHAFYSGDKHYRSQKSNVVSLDLYAENTKLELTTTSSLNDIKPYDLIEFNAKLTYIRWNKTPIKETIVFINNNHPMTCLGDFKENTQAETCEEDKVTCTIFKQCKTYFTEGSQNHEIKAQYPGDQLYAYSEDKIDLSVKKVSIQFNNFTLFPFGGQKTDSIMVGKPVCVELTPAQDNLIINPITKKTLIPQLNNFVLKFSQNNSEIRTTLAYDDVAQTFGACTNQILSDAKLRDFSIEYPEDLVYNEIKKSKSVSGQKIKTNLVIIPENTTIKSGESVTVMTTLSVADSTQNTCDFYQTTIPLQQKISFSLMRMAGETETKTDITCKGENPVKLQCNNNILSASCTIDQNLLFDGKYKIQSVFDNARTDNAYESSEAFGSIFVENKKTPIIEIANDLQSIITPENTKIVATANFSNIYIDDIQPIGNLIIKLDNQTVESCDQQTYDTDTKQIRIECLAPLTAGGRRQVTAYYDNKNEIAYGSATSGIKFYNIVININYAACDIYQGCAFNFKYDTNSEIGENNFVVSSIETATLASAMPLQSKPDKIDMTIGKWSNQDKRFQFKCTAIIDSFSTSFDCNHFVPFADDFKLEANINSEQDKPVILYFHTNSHSVQKVNDDNVAKCGRFGLNPDNIEINSHYTTEQRIYDCSKRVQHFAGYGNGQPNGAVNYFKLGETTDPENFWFLVSCETNDKKTCSWLTPNVRQDDGVRSDQRYLWSEVLSERKNFFEANQTSLKSFRVRSQREPDPNGGPMIIVDYYDRYLVYNLHRNSSEPMTLILFPFLLDGSDSIVHPNNPKPPYLFIADNFLQEWLNIPSKDKNICQKYDIEKNKGLIRNHNYYNWEMPSYPIFLLMTGGTLIQPMCEQGRGDNPYGLNDRNGCLTVADDIAKQKEYRGFRASSLIPNFSEDYWTSSAANENSGWKYDKRGYIRQSSYTSSEDPIRCVSTVW